MLFNARSLQHGLTHGPLNLPTSQGGQPDYNQMMDQLIYSPSIARHTAPSPKGYHEEDEPHKRGKVQTISRSTKWRYAPPVREMTLFYRPYSSKAQQESPSFGNQIDMVTMRRIQQRRATEEEEQRLGSAPLR